MRAVALGLVLLAGCGGGARPSPAPATSVRPAPSYPPLKPKPRIANNPEDCETLGGKWGPRGLLGHVLCDVPTRDAGRACADSAHCESVCVTDNNVEPGQPAAGTCYERQVLLGNCLNLVRNGKAQGQLCTD